MTGAGEPETWPGQLPPESRAVLFGWADTKDDAVALCDTLRAVCGREVMRAAGANVGSRSQGQMRCTASTPCRIVPYNLCKCQAPASACFREGRRPRPVRQAPHRLRAGVMRTAALGEPVGLRASSLPIAAEHAAGNTVIGPFLDSGTLGRRMLTRLVDKLTAGDSDDRPI